MAKGLNHDLGVYTAVQDEIAASPEWNEPLAISARKPSDWPSGFWGSFEGVETSANGSYGAGGCLRALRGKEIAQSKKIGASVAGPDNPRHR
ncbi:MAG: hypothetical protein WBE72_17530 [Terracidiphilus sp.]